MLSRALCLQLWLTQYHCGCSLAHLVTQISWGAAQLTSRGRASLLGFVDSVSSSSSMVGAAWLRGVPFHLAPWSPFPRATSVCGLVWVAFEEVRKLEVNTHECPLLLVTSVAQALLYFIEESASG